MLVEQQMAQQPTAQQLEEVKKFNVSHRLLLSIYLVIPISALIIATDFFALDQSLLKNYLPDTPDQWAFWTIFFGMPHIISSIITLADKEYISHYKQRLWKPFLLFTVIVLVTMPFANGRILFLAFFASYTVYHVLSQQLGIGLMMLKRRPDQTTKIWRWSIILSAIFIYAIGFANSFLEAIKLGDINMLVVFNGILALTLSATLVLTYKLHKEAKANNASKIALTYLWSNALIAFSCFLCVKLDYIVFAIIIPRVIHDITAFTIYSVHDQNRNSVEYKNVFYKVFSFTRLPPILLCPLISIAIALAFRNEMVVMIAIGYIVSLFHYHLESFVWKGDAIHRHCVPFKG